MIFGISATDEQNAERFWFIIFTCCVVVLLLVAGFFVPLLQKNAWATTWVITEDVDTANDYGRANNIVLNSSNYPDVVYYDKTSHAVRFATRGSDGTWTKETIETIGADYNFGDVNNIKYGIAVDPTDNKTSVLYCNYAFGGGAASSRLRLAHRVGNGTGNCGTSNNWQCSSVDAGNDSCSMRMVQLMYHATSSQPVAAYIENSGAGTRTEYAEYNGTSWSFTSTIGNNALGANDQEQAAMVFTTSSEPLIFYATQFSGSITRVYYTYRRVSDFTWQTPVVVDSIPYRAGGDLKPISAVKDASGNIWAAYATYFGELRYAKLVGSTLTTSTIYTTASSTWNSIAIINSNPAVAWYDSTNGDLRYATYSGGVWTGETVSSTNDVGRYAALTSYNNFPVISYYDFTNTNESFISATAFNRSPTAPTVLYTGSVNAQTGSTNPTSVATGTPVFSALFQDPDTGDTASKAEIQVTTTTDGFSTITHWDSGSSGNTISSTAIGARIPDIVYNNFGTAASTSIGLADDGVEGGTNTTYYWRMRLWDNSGLAGTWSATNTFSILDRPLPPTGEGVTFGATTAVIVWTDNSAIEDSYEALISTDGSTYSHTASTTAASIATTSTSGLTPNTQYFFEVRAYNKAGYSTTSSAASGYTLANIPTTLQASSSAYDTVNLSWNANSNPAATAYYVSNVTAGSNSGWNTGTAYSFTGLQGAKSYSFQVKARNTSLTETSYTSLVSTTTLANTPGTLSGVQSGTSVVLGWSANGNSSGAQYFVENVTLGTTSTAQSGFTYTWSGLTIGQTYVFRVVAQNSDGIYSAYSNQVSVTLSASNPSNSSQVSVMYQQAQEEQKKLQQAPSGSFTISSNGDFAFASSTAVDLNIKYSSTAAEMIIANDLSFSNASWQPVASHVTWQLIEGSGLRTVYLKFRNASYSSDVYAQSITLDQTPPAKPAIIAPQNSAQFVIPKQPTFSGTADPLTAVRVEIFRKGFASPLMTGDLFSDAQGAWKFQPIVDLPGGNYVVYATAFDQILNKSESDEREFSVIDTAPPSPPTIITPIGGGMVTSSTVSTSGTAKPFERIMLYRDGLVTYQIDADANGEWSYTIPAELEDGPHTFEYFAVNPSNNQQSDKVLVTFTVKAAAVVQKPKPVEKPQEKPPVQKPPIPPPKIVKTVAPAPSPSQSQTIGQVTVPSAPAETTPGGVPIEQVSPIETTPITSPQPEVPQIEISQPAGILTAASALVDTITEGAKKVGARTVVAAKYAREVANKPEVQVANQAVVVPVTAAAAVGTATSAMNFAQLATYARFLFTQPLFLFTRKRRKGWGMAYNALTKMPADLALVRIVDSATGHVVQSRVTDRDGRYQFFAQPGAYTIEVSKPTFTFPPAYMQGKTEDGKLADLYTGGALPLTAAGQISYNLPLDPGGEHKPTEEILRESTKKRLAEGFGAAGVAVTAFSFVVSPTWLVGGFLGLHVISYFVFRRLARPPKPKTWAVVKDASGKPLARAVVRIFDTQYNKLLETQVTDADGRYSFLVGSNTYYVMAEKPGFAQLTTEPITVDAPEGGAALARDITLQPVSEAQPPVQPQVSSPPVPAQ